MLCLVDLLTDLFFVATFDYLVMTTRSVAFTGRWFVIILLLCFALEIAAKSCVTSPIAYHPRIFILSDIANEPDDAESLVRLLLYSNLLRIEGIVATTSFHLNSSTHPEQMRDIIQAYGEVLPNLRQHEGGWPDSKLLLEKVKSGLPVYGMDGVGPGKDNEGSELLIKSVDESDEDIWVSIWGGASVLAQALYKVKSQRSADKVDKFISKVRVYAISDQDNSASWIRRNFPSLFYISSVHHFTKYNSAAWNGISGETYYGYEGGPDSSLVSREWFAENIQGVGPLGAKYPDFAYIPEGDTPAFLYLIPNGLSDPARPEWGSWGGRYGPVNFGEGHHSDTVDTVLGADGKHHTSSSATIWRWRPAYQNDFAARMRWTVTPTYSDANHMPVAIIEGHCQSAIIDVYLPPGRSITFNASASYDPDGNSVSFHWWQYFEPSGRKRNIIPILSLKLINPAAIEISLPSVKDLTQYYQPQSVDKDGFKRELHIILEVTDSKLTAYRRIVVHIDIPADDMLIADQKTLTPGSRTKDEL